MYAKLAIVKTFPASACVVQALAGNVFTGRIAVKLMCRMGILPTLMCGYSNALVVDGLAVFICNQYNQAKYCQKLRRSASYV